VITNGNKLACAQRELAFRQRVYPRWIEQGRYTEVKAALEIAMMEAVVEVIGSSPMPSGERGGFCGRRQANETGRRA
jgi:hypothetical protein